MLDLAAERTWGAHPFLLPVEHTAYARDRLVDAMVAAGDLDVIAGRVEQQFAAGATHVCLGVAGTSPVAELAMDTLRELAALA